jgi:hypothetical protein
MASHAQLVILRQKFLEEKRTLDATTGRLIKHKLNFTDGDPVICQLVDDAAMACATGSARLETILEHIEMRLR